MILFLAACTGGKDLPELTGTVLAESGESAEVHGVVAYGVTTGDKAGIVVSPNGSATCADAAAFATGGDEDFDGEVVSGEGVCNVYVLIDGYDGAELTLTDDTAATIALNCAMDTGDWNFEERGSGYEGWFYSGPWWVGSPEGYTLTLSGGDGADLTLALDMDTYTGRFPYDNEDPEADPATGAVTGGVTATWCEDMGPALN